MKTFRGLPSALSPYAPQERWDLWRCGINKKGKPTKVPYQAHHPSRLASSKDPATWSDFPTALRAYEAGHGDGIVLCLLGSDLTAFDLDDCRNATTGEIEPAARDLVARTFLCRGHAKRHRLADHRQGQRPESASQAGGPRSQRDDRGKLP